MDPLILGVIVVIGVGAGVATVAWLQLRAGEAKPPAREWKGDKVTPVMLGPRNKAPERAGRRMVMTQGVLLAATMARRDGEVTESEVQTIRDFILEHVNGADQEFTDNVMRDGLTATVSAAVIDASIETLRAVGSDEQRRLLIGLFVAVAQADGVVDPREEEFMIEIGERLGLSEDAVKERLKL